MIVVDVHEPEAVVEYLRRKGVNVLVKAISPGDYVVGGIGIERKSMRDFYRSIIKKRLFDQISRLKEAYLKCFLVVEGNLLDISFFRNPNIFWGSFLSIILDMEVPIVFTPSLEETANLLSTLERKLGKRGEGIYLRYKPKMLSEDDWKLYIVQGLPMIGPKTAERLLERFGTVRRIFNANVTELMSVQEIGEKKARKIVDLLTSKYRAQKTL